MTRLVFRRPACKPRVFVTTAIEAQVTALLATTSQQQIARQLGISQSSVSRIARRSGCAANPITTVTAEVA